MPRRLHMVNAAMPRLASAVRMQSSSGPKVWNSIPPPLTQFARKRRLPLIETLEKRSIDRDPPTATSTVDLKFATTFLPAALEYRVSASCFYRMVQTESALLLPSGTSLTAALRAVTVERKHASQCYLCFPLNPPYLSLLLTKFSFKTREILLTSLFPSLNTFRTEDLECSTRDENAQIPFRILRNSRRPGHSISSWMLFLRCRA